MARNEKHDDPAGMDPALFLPIEPVRLFDDYYFVGNQLVGFHILKTREGLVLFDAMDKTTVDEEFLIPGLKKLGLEREKILTLFLTHGHFDHYMGAETVRRRTGCKVALSVEDTAYLAWADENMAPGIQPDLPRITQLVKDGDEFSFGDHTVYVMGAPGHTPGCLNYSFTVHDHGTPHRVMMVGGYGVFGPGNFMGRPYPYGVETAVNNAFLFASSCVKTWEYCKEHHCDVYLNPHPHLCGMLDLARENESRREGQENAFVIGTEGVRKNLEALFDRCIASALQYTDIKSEYQKTEH